MKQILFTIFQGEGGGIMHTRKNEMNFIHSAIITSFGTFIALKEVKFITILRFLGLMHCFFIKNLENSKEAHWPNMS